MGGRCLVQDHEASAGAPLCVAVSGEMVLVAGATESVLAADEVARRHRPPVGRCVRYTGDGEQVLLIHPREGLLIALATRVQAWERYRGLRAALRSGRCPNRLVL